jgi:methionyl-tRNA formyltransferase
MRILFAGTPELAVSSLEALVGAAHHVAVLTNPDRALGRSSKPEPSSVKKRASALGLGVFTPEKLDKDFRSLIEGRFDLLVSFAFGRIFGPKFLSLFPLGGLNVHPSLLPRWRGSSPLSAAILALDTKTGICVQTLAPKMDEGDIVARLERQLDGTETTETLTAWAAKAAPELLVSAVEAWGQKRCVPEPQRGEPTYCGLLKKEDGRLDWSLPARNLDARVRACDPWPGAFTFWKGQVLMIRKSRWLGRDKAPPSVLSAPKEALTGQIVALDKSEGILVQTGEGLLALRELQLAGRKPLDFRSFVNGARDFVGSRLGEET